MSLAELLAAKKQNLAKGTIITKRVKSLQGVVQMLEMNFNTFEMVTVSGASLEVTAREIFALQTPDGSPCLVAFLGANKYFFKVIHSDEAKTTTEKVHEWYGHKYIQVYDVLPVKVQPKIPEELIPYEVNVLVSRPILEPIEAAVDIKLYDIIPGFKLYLGSQDAATNEEGMDTVGCKNILNVATGISYNKNPKFNYKTIEVLDHPDSRIRNHFEECFAFIDAAIHEGGCLVHCNAGVSRSATVCIAYIMTKQKLRFNNVYTLVKSVKKDIKPNEGFVIQLQEYEKRIVSGY